MPKYICKTCGTECYGCILYTLETCHSCGAKVDRDDVEETWKLTAQLADAKHPGLPENTDIAKLLPFVR